MSELQAPRVKGHANESSAHSDFSVVVKLRAVPPNPWRWEIYRAGRSSSIMNSKDFFESATLANKAGQSALKLLLSEFQD